MIAVFTGNTQNNRLKNEAVTNKIGQLADQKVESWNNLK
jgi:hypothetical protein